MRNVIPVYLFMGFLESGKTRYIQEALEGEWFETGDRPLLLVCEEGEIEYDPTRFRMKDVAIEHLDESEVTPARLMAIEKQYAPNCILIEWNGMGVLDTLFNAMPEGWQFAQITSFFDSATFLSYNKNMRQLVFDKVQNADMVVFNRFRDAYSKEEFHKLIRGISRRPAIVYEYENGRVEYDEIVDPLPFDINAEIIEIKDEDYAFFYRDLMENMQNYAGKSVRFKGLVAVDRRMKAGTLVVGRHIMTCCEADITYSGMVAIHASALPFKTRDWVELTARIDIEYHKIYDMEGPVLKVRSIDFCEPPQEELATFY